MENIEIKKAWYVTHETIKETTGFAIEVEGNYNTTSELVYYKGEKAWKQASTWQKEVVFSIDEAQELKKKKIVEQLKYLKEYKENTEASIQKMEEELAS